MPLATNLDSRASSLPTHTRWLLLAVTLVWLVGCAMPNARKSGVRDPFSKGEKFSCGEKTPKGSTR